MLPSELRLQSLSDEGEYWLYRFGDLVFRTESLSKPAADRVIPLGGAAGILMAYMARNPDLVRGKRIIEPFSGCGPLGLLALHLNAAHVCCVDVNPRAMEFLDHNVDRNGLDRSRLQTAVSDIASFEPDALYDWLFANPPFIPTPDGIGGALHSAAGIDGNRPAGILLSRLSRLLKPDGQAMLFMFQIEAGGEPTLAEQCRAHLPERPVEFTTRRHGERRPFQDLVDGYHEKLPDRRALVDRWAEQVRRHLGSELTLGGYVVHVGPVGKGSGIVLREYDGTKYGEGFFQHGGPGTSARGVVFENLPGIG